MKTQLFSYSAVQDNSIQNNTDNRGSTQQTIVTSKDRSTWSINSAELFVRFTAGNHYICLPECICTLNTTFQTR